MPCPETPSLYQNEKQKKICSSSYHQSIGFYAAIKLIPLGIIKIPLEHGLIKFAVVRNYYDNHNHNIADELGPNEAGPTIIYVVHSCAATGKLHPNITIETPL